MAEKSPYVLVSVFKEDAKAQDVAAAAGTIATIIDDWNAKGNMIWSGSFDDNKTAMSVIEGDKDTAQSFFISFIIHVSMGCNATFVIIRTKTSSIDCENFHSIFLIFLFGQLIYHISFCAFDMFFI